MLTYTKSHKMKILLYKAMHIYKECTHVLDFDFTLCLERKLKNLAIKVGTYREGLQRALRDPGFAFNLKLGIRDFKAKWGRDGGYESVRGRWDAKNNSRDYSIARTFGSGLRD